MEDPMKLTICSTLIYGILTTCGGVFGFYIAHSTTSLIMGVLYGVSLIICSLLLAKGKKNVLPTTAGLTAMLFAVFTMRFMKTGSFIPAGMLALLALIPLTLQIKNLRKKKAA